VRGFAHVPWFQETIFSLFTHYYFFCSSPSFGCFPFSHVSIVHPIRFHFFVMGIEFLLSPPHRFLSSSPDSDNNSPPASAGWTPLPPRPFALFSHAIRNLLISPFWFTSLLAEALESLFMYSPLAAVALI